MMLPLLFIPPEFYSADTLFFLFVGVLFFMIMGILPALGAPEGLAILLPLIYRLNTYQVFALAMGGAAGVYLSGTITSVLLKIPGTTEHVSLTYDGHELAKQGKAGEALGAAATSALIAGVASPLLLLLLVPVLREVLLLLGPAEILFVVLWGLLAATTLAGKSKIKGYFCLFFGLLLSTIGFSLASQVPRFVFGGFYELWEGIPLVPFFIGILAIPEMLDALVKGETYILKGGTVNPFKGLISGIKEPFKSIRVLLQGTIMGFIIGVIPGIGGATANLVAYAQASTISKRPQKFGEGNIDGVISPQASIAAVWGGALLPTLTFGVPGSETMALILGIFIIKGLVPGVPMFTQHIDIVYFLVWMLILGAIVGTVVVLMLSPLLVKIAKVKTTTWVPIVMGLIFLGVFALRSTYFDLLLLLLLGLLGYEMKKHDFPRGPFVIAFILGSIIENQFSLSWQVYGLSFLYRPSVLLIMALIGITIFYSSYRSYKGRK